MMIKNKILKIITVVILLFSVTTPVFAQQTIDGAFNPNKLVSDKVFSDTQTFGGAAGIQKFLETKGSVLAQTGSTFLEKLKEPQITMLKQNLEDPEPNLGRLRTAAELIWDASVQSGLNPQVILVTLNKEQGLVTSKTDPNDPSLQKALDHAMGFDCPDATGCGNLFPGFYYQLFGNYDSSNNRYLGAAKSLMKSFSANNGRGPSYNGAVSHVGDVIILDNTLGGYDGVQPQQTVTLTNNATAALYRFTPHVFNGNYNFWRYFNAWFKYPNGTLLKLASSADTYIIENGVKQLIPIFVAQSRGLSLANSITVSPNEFSTYDSDKPYGPADNTVVTVAGDTHKYVFIANVKHPASDLVIKQRGLDPTNTLSVTSPEAQIFDNGPVLTPKDGTIIRGVQNKGVYLVQNGTIKLFSAYTFAQQKISTKKIYPVPDDEIVTYTQSGFVAPNDGSLVKSPNDGTIYLIDKGLKQPVLGDIFKNRGFSFKNVGTLSGDELSALPIGSYAYPKDNTFFAVESKTGPLYEFKQGTKHSISPYVAKQRGITADFVFTNPVVVEWFEGIPVPPKDSTIIKGDQDTAVYIVLGGQLKPLTAEAFAKRKIKPKQIVTLPQIEVDAYAKGDVVSK